jgi:hypothetical protein
VVLVQPAVRDGAAKLAEDGIHFLDSIDKLCSFAADYLGVVGRQVGLLGACNGRAPASSFCSCMYAARAAGRRHPSSVP